MDEFDRHAGAADHDGRAIANVRDGGSRGRNCACGISRLPSHKLEANLKSLMKETDFVSGVSRGLKVIEAFGETQQRLSITEASKLTGFDRATMLRSLLTLAQLAYLAATPLSSIIQPYLDQLAEQAAQCLGLDAG